MALRKQTPASALASLAVIDMSESIAGQYCGRLMADFGANVTLVEPRGGSVLRRAAPIADRSLMFFHLNHGKRSIELDERSQAGRAARTKLTATADVLIAAAGQDTQALLASNPNGVIAVAVPFSETGPWADRSGCELIYQAMSGGMTHNGEPDRAPLYGCGHRASFAAGLALYTGILAALMTLRAGGPGQVVTVSIAAVAASMTTATTVYAYSGAEDGRAAGEHRLRCRDGHVGIWLYSHLWPGFCEAIGRPELRDDPRFAAPDDRQRNWRELLRIVQQIVADQSADELVARLRAHRLIAAKAATLTELVATDGHLRARGFWESVEHEGEVRPVLRAPFLMGRSRPDKACQAPQERASEGRRARPGLPPGPSKGALAQ